MLTVVGVIVGIVGLGFLILVHEFGHFIVAKLTGMRVEEFSLGFGPYLVSKRIGETVYGISAVPLGGYVRVTGMHKEEFDQRVADARADEAEERAETGRRRPQDPEDRLAGARALSADEIAATPLEKRYYSHPFWHKLLFVIAGVVMNMIVAFALLYVVGVTQGESWRSTVVAAVASGSGAEAAGMQAGDRIVSVGGTEIESWEDLRWEILKYKNETVTIEVYRGEKKIAVYAKVSEDERGLAVLGVQSTEDIEHRDIGGIGAFAYAGQEVGSTVVIIFEGIGMMFTRDVPATGSEGLAGPVGIVQLSSSAFESGYASYLWLLALISINLALLNMLPLLPLDGGHVVVNIYERIRGRSISLRVFERVSTVGLGLFGLLFLVAMYNDVGRLISG